MDTDEFLELPELVDKIQELLEMGLFDEGLKLLDRYADFYQDEWEIQYLYSRVHLEQNDPAAAIGYLHKSLKIDRNNLDCLLGLFYAHSQMGQLKKSGKFLLKAEKYHPESEPVLSALIWYYTEINDLETAVAYFEKARKMATDNPETFRNGGIAFERIGDYEAAESCFLQALRLNPAFDDVRDLLADHYILIGQIDKGIQLYRDYLTISPNNIRALSRLVFCLSQNNLFKEAVAQAEATIRLYPNSPVGYVDCAYVHLNAGKYDDALAFADKALDVSPIDAEALRVKGIAYSEKHLDDESRGAFEAALRLEPSNPEIMRDYYHHLRSVGKFQAMEKMVNRVIRQEYPYCIEDFWFLADYYRDNGDNLKAFHFLHKAYTSMPGEKELIPPMLNILLDEGHVLYSVPFMMRYIERSGWNDTMNQFARHNRLKGKWPQEGLRFLRFYGQDSPRFRRYIFLVYVEKFLFGSLCAFLPLVMLVLYMYKGWLAAACGFLAGAALFGGWVGVKAILRKRASEDEQSEG
jgi:tetratricopeptide (TPR) repeat protein